jgi:hypothetical protein
LLAGQPEAGHRLFVTTPELQGIRRLPVFGGFEKIRLFDYPLADGIEPVRAVHASRDLARLLLEGFFK